MPEDTRTPRSMDLNQLTKQLRDLGEEAEKVFSGAEDSQSLYQSKVDFIGKNGKVTEVMKSMGGLSPTDKPIFGKSLNEVKQSLEDSYKSHERRLKHTELEKRIQAERIDMALPGSEHGPGSRHPVSIVTEEICQIMARLGYSVRLGPLIEKDYYNFEALNFPPDHPAREMQDTFFIDREHVLRTHTSPIQVRTLETEKPPLRVLGVGSVFRCDSDVSHLPHFHQVEGMCVDHKVSMADLKGTISFMLREYFGSQLKTRFRPSFFPFTEPSAEFDCSCPLCSGKGCGLCKNSGWIEIGGAGLINPRVLKFAKVNYPDWQGFAFGFGVERMAIIRYGIDDIRHFPENDLRFLKQF